MESFMSEHILAQAPPLGGYIAIWKLAVFLALFVFWACVGQWVDKDTLLVRTNRSFWNNIYLGAGTVAIALWFLVPAPIFIVHLLLFVVIWAMVLIVYILHRNSRVSPEERLLTPDHIRHVFAGDKKRREAQKRLIFISANKNQLPIPDRQAPEYDGYVNAEDMVYEIGQRRVSRSDLLPTGDNYQQRVVIDGVLSIAGDISREDAEAAIGYLKEVGGMDQSDKRRPQKGKFTVRTETGQEVKFNVRTAGSTRGEQMLLERVEEFRTMGLDELGMSEDQLQAMQEVIEIPDGIVLVCGEKASGATTSLYSVVRKHDAFIQNVHSIESDILVELDNITQNIVDENLNDHDASIRLQSVLRVDPDVIMVGFCTGSEMALMAQKAARQGKKLYVTFNSPGTFEALEMWLKWVGDPVKASQTLRAVTCQRLIRKLCPDCREAYAPNADLLRKLNLPADKIKQFYRPPTQIETDKHGNPILCETCQGTGYYGRTAVFETLFINDAMAKLIAEKAPINTLRAQSRKNKMLYLQEQAIRRVIDATTSIQEVSRVTAEKPARKAKPKSAPPKEKS